MTQEQITHTLGRHSEQIDNQRREIDELKNNSEQQRELVTSVKVIAVNVEKLGKSLEKVWERVEKLETAPVSRLRNKVDYVIKYMIIFVLTAVMAYIFSRFGM